DPAGHGRACGGGDRSGRRAEDRTRGLTRTVAGAGPQDLSHGVDCGGCRSAGPVPTTFLGGDDDLALHLAVPHAAEPRALEREGSGLRRPYLPGPRVIA